MHVVGKQTCIVVLMGLGAGAVKVSLTLKEDQEMF